ncbi:hypothetical protein [Anaerotignum sp.]|uniref:hypothetical protein n=1 Tax=Anaerotignum sp. TaxID=2039241 RepID=UPI00289AF3D9|nr:hypothetical protein [Anaerotignum sp.]
MKEYLLSVKKWMMLFFIVYLGAAMGCGTKLLISLIIEGQFGYILIFTAYPFLIPLFQIAWTTVYIQEDKPTRPIWVNIPPPPTGARCVPTTPRPVHPPKAK